MLRVVGGLIFTPRVDGLRKRMLELYTTGSV